MYKVQKTFAHGICRNHIQVLTCSDLPDTLTKVLGSKVVNWLDTICMAVFVGAGVFSMCTDYSIQCSMAASYRQCCVGCMLFHLALTTTHLLSSVSL